MHTLSLNAHVTPLPIFAEEAFFSDCPFARLLHKLGPSLSTVTHLHLDSIDPEEYLPFEDGVQDEELSLLLSFCPAVTSCTTERTLPGAVFCRLGQACPGLTSLTIKHTFLEKMPDLDGLLQLLPSLIPVLVYTTHDRWQGREEATLEDMSEHAGILSLDASGISFHYDGSSKTEAEWLELPPKLQQLKCKAIMGGPPPLRGGAPLLGSLLNVSLSGTLYLDALSKLLRAAPALQVIHMARGLQHPAEHSGSGSSSLDVIISIECPFTLSTAADLLVVEDRMDAGLRMNAVYSFCGTSSGPIDLFGRDKGDRDLYHSFVNALPCLKHVKKCFLNECWLPDPFPFFRAFPDLQFLRLSHIAIDGDDLQAVAACAQLRVLHLDQCDGTSADGLDALCKLLPLMQFGCVF